MLGLEYAHVWREDILPCAALVRVCLEAAETVNARENFLTTTVLADRVTSLDSYVTSLETVSHDSYERVTDSYEQFKCSPFWFV